MKKIMEKVNVAPSSDEGHYVENATNVINLDEVTESFKVSGKSILTTKRHTTLPIDEDCLIHCQLEYNPFKQMFEKSKD